MKNLKKILSLTFVSFTILSLSSCRNDSSSDFGSSCTRLNSCFNVYADDPTLINDIQLQNDILQAINSKQEGQCSSVITQLSSKVSQGCPF